MTAFPTSAVPPAPRQPREIIDEAVTAGRATRSPDVANLRAVPRKSIAEINQSDIEDLRDSYLKQTYDDRGPVTKFLDLIDAPRNLILGALAPSLESKARAAGDTATLGRGRVNFSDVLGSLGVENRVARGVLGFVGDVAFDPLTYLGPAGLGAKVALKGGGQLGIRKAGVSFLREGSQALAKGAAVDPIIGGLAKGAGLTEKRLGVIRGAADKQRALDIVRGRIEGKITTGGVGRALSRVGLHENEVSGGAVAKLFQGGGPDEGVAAAREFVGKFGKGTEPGLGAGTSQIAHIPFTDIGINVPAISHAGRSAMTNLKIAADTSNGVDALRAFEKFGGASGPYGSSQEVFRLRNQVEDALDLDAPGPAADRLARLDTHLEALKATANSNLAGVTDTPSGLFALAHAKREAQALADQSRAMADRYAAVGRLSSLAPEDPLAASRLTEIMDGLDTDPVKADLLAKANSRAAEAADTLAQLYAAPIRSVMDKDTAAMADVAKRALGTADDQIGTTAMGSLRSAMRNAGLSATNPAVETAARLDRRLGQWTGVRGGTLDTLFRDSRSWGRARAIRDQIGGEISKRVNDLMAAHNIPAERTGEIDAYLSMLAHREAGMNDGFFWDAWHPGWKPESSNWQAVMNGDANPSAMSEALLSAQSGGLLSPNVHPGLADDLKKLASEWVGRFKEVGDAEVRDALLRGLNPAYVPLRATKGGAERMARVVANETAAAKIKGAGGIASTQPFERTRSTMQYRFIGQDGKAHRFFEFDRTLADLNDKQLAEMFDDPKALAMAKEGRDAIKEYDALVKSGADVPPPRPTDPWELNELAKTGRFRMLLGAATGDFMETNFPIIAAERMYQHERAVAASNLRKVVRGIGIQMPEAQAQKILNEPGAHHALPGGVRVTFLRAPSAKGTQVGAFRLGDTVYRQLDPVMRSDGAFKAAFGDELSGVMLPSRFADRVEDVARVVSEQNNLALEAAEAVTGAFRKVTLFHPSWIINNVLGNIVLALGGDSQGGRVRIADIVRHAGNVAKMFWNRYDPEKLRGITFNVAGRTVSGETLLADLERLRVADENRILTELYGARQTGLYNPGSRPGLRDAVAEHLHEGMMARGRDTADAIDWAKAAGNTIGDKLNRRVFGPWARLNSHAENTSRTLVYLSYLEQGYSPTEAAASTMRTLFDYGDLTRVEQKMRTLVPFYSWLKNNTAYQMRALMERPAIAAAFPKVKEAIEESLVGGSAVPDHQRPQWMRDSLAVQYSRDPQTRQFLLAASALPVEQLYQLGAGLFGQDGIKDVMHYFVSSLSPLAQVPIGLGTGREPFSGRTIGSEGDMSVGRYLANQVRPINEIGTESNPGGLRRAVEQGPLATVSRLTLGGKVQDASDERLYRQNLRAFQDREQKLRAKINRAESRGDKAASLETRAALLKQYETMMGRGFTSEVPRWAQRQIGELAS